MPYVLVSGCPASPEWLSKVLALQFGSPCSVTRFSPVEGTRVSGAHSVTEKVSVEYASNAGTVFPTTIYWKQIIVKDLPAKASYKLLRDVTSYRTETRFYQHFSHQLIQKGVRVPKCFHGDELFVEHDLNASQFLLLLEDLSGSSFTQQHIFLSLSHTLACLDYLAALHSTFWDKSTIGGVDLSLLWEKGTYWTLDKRPPNEIDTLPSVWSDFCTSFGETSEIFKQDKILNLGKRLVSKTPWITETLQQCKTPRTLVHGDFKSANIFFREDTNTKEIKEVAVIDFQWSGKGLGISDVMYLVLGAFNLGLWENQFALEKKLVAYYCEKLAERGIKYAVVDAIREFRIVALDFARVIFAYFFKSYTPQSLSTAIKDAGELTHTSSLPHIIDLLLYFDLLLSQLETYNEFIPQQ